MNNGIYNMFGQSENTRALQDLINANSYKKVDLDQAKQLIQDIIHQVESQ